MNTKTQTTIDWTRVASLVLTSRWLDEIEEEHLVPERKVLYQFSSRGHDLAQVLLGLHLTHPHDGVSAYYRSRPLMLTLGVPLADAMAGPLMQSGGYSDGRDIGVVCNFPNPDGPTVLPMSGDVGSQYTPAVGWAQMLEYRQRRLKDKNYEGAITVVLGGDGSVATNGFWSSLTIATTLRLPVLFFIEDNGYGISVPSYLQTPGANIARNLGSFQNLRVMEGDGTDPDDASRHVGQAVKMVREGRGPVLLRLTLPRLSGHSGQDNQSYKPSDLLDQERANDPLLKLHQKLVPSVISLEAWKELEENTQHDIEKTLQEVAARPAPDPAQVARYLYAEPDDPAQQGGMASEEVRLPTTNETPQSEPKRINMVLAIRRTLAHELHVNSRVVVFGEDVGQKGGVHTATLGLQEAFGPDRVFDTSLSEEGIIGRAVGMALGGLKPVAEIQFRKYADPATEQLNNCGTLRWRTANRFAAPIVVRMPGGFAKVGDPWHSVTNEAFFAHAIGWHVAFPSNAEDAVGLLRTALRSENPTIFFEHRNLLDASWARRPYPGDQYALPFGKGRRVLEGEDLTVVSWGAMVERCEAAAKESGVSVDLIDLRTIVPWDREMVLESVARTKRCLIVHEDAMTGGFGGEIAAVVAKEAFFNLDAPIERMAVPDIPIPHNPGLMDAVVPRIDQIAETMQALVDF